MRTHRSWLTYRFNEPSKAQSKAEPENRHLTSVVRSDILCNHHFLTPPSQALCRRSGVSAECTNSCHTIRQPADNLNWFHFDQDTTVWYYLHASSLRPCRPYPGSNVHIDWIFRFLPSSDDGKVNVLPITRAPTANSQRPVNLWTQTTSQYNSFHDLAAPRHRN